MLHVSPVKDLVEECAHPGRELAGARGREANRAIEFLADARTGLNIKHEFPAPLRQSPFSRIAGYDDTNDADRLASDPTLRLITGRFDPTRSAARSRTLGRFEADVLAREENLLGLSHLNASWVEQALNLTPHKRVILDLDSSVSHVHGSQEGLAYNGHFQTTCYHSLFHFNQ